MARSTDKLWVSLGLGALLVGCSGGPSKTTALDIIQRDLREDGACTLPIELITAFKMQYATKALCVPNEGAQAAARCVDALVAAGMTAPMPKGYMLDWSEAPSVGSVYDHHARSLVFSTCVEMRELRDGRFPCADVRADKIVRNKKVDDTHYDVVYSRIITPKASLTAIEAACGPTTRPAEDAVASFVKGASGWALVPAAPP